MSVVENVQNPANFDMEDVTGQVTIASQSLGEILVTKGKISPQDAERIIQYQHANHLRFGEAAVKLKLITRDELDQVLASQFFYPYLPAGEGGFSRELVAAYKPFSKQVEALRVVRSHLMLRWFSDERKSLVVTSPGFAEGRSYTVANLGIVFSQLGEKTLLIDADLRQPRLHAIFNLSNDLGLSSLLSGRSTVNSIQRINEFTNLSVLPAGAIPPNPQELLSNDRFSVLMASVSKWYDVILVDTPAACSYSDAEITASRVGGALVLTRKGKSRIKDTRSTVDKLSSAGVQIVGTVLNDV